MKKLFFSFALVMLTVHPNAVFSWQQKSLAGMFEPEMMTFADNELHIGEGTNILVFSLKDLSLTVKFSRQGEGPGEFKAADVWYNTVAVLPDHISVDGFDKTVLFFRNGQFLKLYFQKDNPKPTGGNYSSKRSNRINERT